MLKDVLFYKIMALVVFLFAMTLPLFAVAGFML